MQIDFNPKECAAMKAFKRGDCMLCVQVHRGHGDHLPHCLQCMINKKLALLSELTEHSIIKEVRQPSCITGESES